MPPKKDNGDGINWDIDNTVKFCDICINYITKNGRGQLIRWREIEDLFTESFGKRCPKLSLKNKFDGMKREWRLWKFLKTGETGLGWNAKTGKLDCSNEWWERKLKFDMDEERDELIVQLILHNQEVDEEVIRYYYTHIYKESCMTSEQTGEAWMKEILNGHPNRCIGAFRMSASLFTKLCEDLQNNYGLTSSDRMSVKENVGIFGYTLALGLSNQDVSERFQRSGETISRAFHEVLESTCGRSKGYAGLAREYIRPKDGTFQCIPPHIANDSRYMPYFKDCIRCIDGTHIDACIQVADQMRYRGRKGVPTFNVMAVCDFDMCFTFISVAHDTRVFLHAIETPSMNFPKPPQGKYYVVDKGYPDRKGYLAPYPRLRYYRSQFEQEAFNRSHSDQMPSFSEKTQIDIIMAAFTLHNYIRRNDSTDRIFNFVQQHSNYIPTEEEEEYDHSRLGQDNIRRSRHEMRRIRNNIANMLWDARHMN